MESLMKPSEQLYERVIAGGRVGAARNEFEGKDTSEWSELAQEVETGAEAPGVTDYTVAEMFQIARILFMLDKPKEFRRLMIEEEVEAILEAFPQVKDDTEFREKMTVFYGAMYDYAATLRSKGLSTEQMTERCADVMVRAGFVQDKSEVLAVAGLKTPNPNLYMRVIRMRHNYENANVPLHTFEGLDRCQWEDFADRGGATREQAGIANWDKYSPDECRQIARILLYTDDKTTQVMRAMRRH